MVGSVLGRNLKDRPVFGRKSGRMSAMEQGGGVTDEEKLPPTSSTAGFVRPMRSGCPTRSATPPARVASFRIIFNPGWPEIKSQDRNL